MHPSLSAPGAVLLVSCYELGHQPFAIASAWAQLEREGIGVSGVDASIEPVDDATFDAARLVAISVPMHTALRLGVAIARRARARNPRAHICLFGLYASMNARYLLDGIADSVIGGEFESALVALAGSLDGSREGSQDGSHDRAILSSSVDPTNASSKDAPILRRLAFQVPRRDRLPGLDRYAKLLGPVEGEQRVVGYVEASRGCLHRCLHCPITSVYDGRFFVVPREVVLADAAQQIAAGARHITFGDPDFLNGVGHSMAIVRELHAAHPEVTFDITVKIEHILKHRDRFAELGRLGCVFMVSAVESLSERVLEELDKGHTGADVIEAIRIAREAGIALRPSYVAFTPWTTLEDYVALCDHIVEQDLCDHVDPIQLAIRLLIPPGSAILRRDRPRPWLGELEPEKFGYRWTHPDPAMDRLHAAVSRVVEEGARDEEDPAETLAKIRALAHVAAGRRAPAAPPPRVRTFVPKLTEPWFCCAEPNAQQLEQVTSCAGEVAPKACCPPSTGS